MTCEPFKREGTNCLGSRKRSGESFGMDREEHIEGQFGGSRAQSQAGSIGVNVAQQPRSSAGL